MELNSTTNEKSSFKEVVQQSREAIEGAPLVEPKIRRRKLRSNRGGFRPGAGRKPNPRPDAVESAGPEINRAPVASPPPDVSKYLAGPLVALSKIPAHKHGIAELALTEDEAKACAEALNNCVQAFIPDVNQMSPKTAAVVTAVLTFGSIGYMKFSIYAAHQAKKNPKPEPEVQSENAERQRTGPVHGADLYSVEHR